MLGHPMTSALLIAQLAPALDAVRLSLHVLAACIWIGGQITVAALVRTTRQLDASAPRLIARAFARLAWPAYVLLLATGIWNVAAVAKGQGTAWKIVLGLKIAVVLLAGLGAWLHGRARTGAGLAVWGAVAALASLSALVMGVFLAG
jgi:putative copper export protein